MVRNSGQRSCIWPVRQPDCSSGILPPVSPEKLLRHGWQALTIGAFSAGMAALWFIGIQVFALGHLCIYCIAAHTCGLVLAGLIAYHQPWAGTLLLALCQSPPLAWSS